MKDVIIIGTGGHAKVVADIVMSSGDNLFGFLTSDTDKTSFLGKPVLGNVSDYTKYKDCYFVIAIGSAAAREEISGSMAGVKWYTAIHPASVISKLETSVGEGSVVMAGAVINPLAQVGKHCIINTHATVEHDNIIDDFAHISIGATLAGTVKIGKRCWVGAGSTVIENKTICADCVIGAGAVVVKNIDTPGTYVGVPAKKIK